MSELTRVTTPAGDPAVPSAEAAADRRLVAAFRERYERLRTADGSRARPFELQLPGGGRWTVGEGEPEFTVRAVGERGRRALAAFDELAVAEAYMDGDLDIEGDLLTALKARPILADRHPLKYLWTTYLQPLLRGQEASDKRWIGSHYDVDPEFFVLWLDEKIRGYSHGFFEHDDEPLAAGMERKFRYAFDACGIRPGQRVLDIGGGWGSFLELAGEQGVHVTSIT
ncbi:MAG TPA: class I SAM-dependent methyltransferase, partial [Thermoanaerobaculia bacterium]|nr:class I SAM-dependent methyltransferase [Thermoanaerobaculia bacterium]